MLDDETGVADDPPAPNPPRRTPRARDLADLVRLPAVVTVPGDALVGAAWSARGWDAHAILAPCASACFYLGGMALNDYADRRLDSQERPERPIPSGRITPRAALTTAAALTLGGLTFSALAGRKHLTVGGALAAAVWLYDLYGKNTAAGPLIMGTTRGLDVLLGAGGDRSALTPALLMTAHTITVTALSRGEVHGSTNTAGYRAVVSTLTIAAATVAHTASHNRSRLGSVVGFCLGHAALAGGAQWRAARSPEPDNVRHATRTGIRSMLTLQAALLAASGAHLAGLALLTLSPALRRLARKIGDTT